MKLVNTVLLLITTSIVAGADSLVELDYFHTLRIPYSHVQVVVDSEGFLTLTTESRGDDKNTRTFQVPQQRIKELRQELETLDWKKISEDHTRGLDGTVVSIIYGEQTASIWSPDYSSRKRGLARLQNVIESLFALAGLNRTGMPE